MRNTVYVVTLLVTIVMSGCSSTKKASRVTANLPPGDYLCSPFYQPRSSYDRQPVSGKTKKPKKAKKPPVETTDKQKVSGSDLDPATREELKRELCEPPGTSSETQTNP